MYEQPLTLQEIAQLRVDSMVHYICTCARPQGLLFRELPGCVTGALFALLPIVADGGSLERHALWCYALAHWEIPDWPRLVGV